MLNPDYVAGFIDAKGLFIYKGGSKGVRFKVSSTDRRVIEGIRDTIGVGEILESKGGRDRPTHTLYIAGRDDLARLVDFLERHPLTVKNVEFKEFKKRALRARGEGGYPLPHQEKEEIYRLYLKGERVEELSRRFKLPKQSIYNIVYYRAKLQGAEGKALRRLSEKDELEICRLYQEGYSTKSIGERFQKTPATILNILSKREVEVDRGYRARMRRPISKKI
jgi:transposase-like protein